MSKAPSAPPSMAPPPYAPPSYSQAVGGVPPQAPLAPPNSYSHSPGGMKPQTQFVPVTAAPTTIMTAVIPLGPQSTRMVCPHCHMEINTATKTSPSTIAYLSAVILCLVGCWLGCCLIPFCMNSCMHVQHNCPSCRAFLGTYKRG